MEQFGDIFWYICYCFPILSKTVICKYSKSFFLLHIFRVSFFVHLCQLLINHLIILAVVLSAWLLHIYQFQTFKSYHKLCCCIQIMENSTRQEPWVKLLLENHSRLHPLGVTSSCQHKWNIAGIYWIVNTGILTYDRLYVSEKYKYVCNCFMYALVFVLMQETKLRYCTYYLVT